mgnify:CR=1 FL=1
MDNGRWLGTVLTIHSEVTICPTDEAEGRVFTTRLEVARSMTRKAGEDGVGDLRLGRDATMRRREDAIPSHSSPRAGAPPHHGADETPRRSPRRASGEEAGRPAPSLSPHRSAAPGSSTQWRGRQS